ncbi:anthranilate phosphoribosyltransferase [Methylocella silvestris BL2]|uniref:Anthranilate phosphoribosyltransferase n=1 Tax=Methylocella silvestris (strain DSM 15510 / CIP 108128 / LMG 27833 / NCIMB 13906 / BL2) TaxID=395965 RepID=TRPD_METSB|nr:anthranilate phosphoribosyltransferase [Methylocella silvestris]B8EJS2.1 RecName: Full=Anthranilate phosphoribosyltransferase [Methylocella silvestris BL2]ACK49476.1 anthranilate phosphoribosyltransferase [Methylocella silvestris BL2]
MDAMKPLLGKLATGASLTQAEATRAFDLIFEGAATPAQLGAFLMALRVRGETIDEIVGAVAAMRARMLRVDAPADAMDIVGTGGDGHSTYNVSTLAALIVSACGVPVAKHGNRAASSQSGASDVLSALGVKIGLDSREVEACLEAAGVAFMSAQAHHAAMRHVAAARAELGTRTIFNILGPLANPAGVKFQLLGVYAKSWLEPLAQALRALGSTRVWLVHGADGLDEATTTGPTHVVALENGAIRAFDITPEDAGLQRAALADLKGGSPAFNAAALKAVLEGRKSPYRDIAILNAAAALIVAGRAADLREGARLAAAAIDDGRAASTLSKLVEASNRASLPAVAAGSCP